MCCLAAGSAQAASRGEWVVFPKPDDDAHGCYAVKHVHKDVSFIIYANNTEGFGVGVTGTSWRLQKGETVHGAAAFDNLPPVSLSGSVEDENTILLYDNNGSEEESDLQTRLPRAQGVRLSYGKSWVTTLPLSGSRQAVNDVYACAEEQTPRETAAPAPAPTPQVSLPRGVKELKRSDCLLEIDGKRRMDGLCDYQALWNNGWKIIGNGAIGEVESTTDNGATFKAKWSDDTTPDKTTDLGEMRWNGRCWEGTRGKICAFALGGRPDAYRIAGTTYPEAEKSAEASAAKKVAPGKGRRTVTGTIKTGTLDSALEVDFEEGYGFMTRSAVGNAIFAKCKMNDKCEVTGVIDKNDFFKSVTKVVKR